MGKKKIIGLCLAVGLMVGVVGGSLAWFTSKDEVTNTFSTASDGSNGGNPEAGIKIHEIFDAVAAGKVLPGSEVNKDVRVQNKATYDQVIRVKFEKVWKANGKPDVSLDKLDKDLILLGYQNLSTTNPGEANKWIEGEDGYFYFNAKIAPGEYTEYLLDHVILSNEADNQYKDFGYDVIVKAESIQASNDAVSSGWTTAPEEIKELGK